MPKVADYNQMATEIIQQLGGKGNLTFVNHCATRLRVNVKDMSLVSEENLKKIQGVLGVSLVPADNEVQVIVGQVIEDVYGAVEKQVGNLSGGQTKSGKKGILGGFANFLMMMAGIMSPIIPPLIAAGLLSVMMLIMEWCGVAADSSTITILTNLQQSVFYFLPIYVAYTAAKKFDTDPVIAMVLGAFLVYPGWVDMVTEGTAAGETFTSYFGIPTMLNTYNSSILQSVLAVWVMSKLDKWLKKVLPVNIRHVLKPLLLLLIMSVITLPFLAPLGAFVTNYIYAGMVWVRNTVPWLGVFAIILFSTTVGVFMPGFHMALMPIAIQSIADVGYDDLINIWFYCCTLTPAFMSLAVGLKTKNKNLKDIAFPASLSAFFGISEPFVYGINYKMPKIYLATMITELTTGLLSGILGLKSYGFGAYSLTNVLLFLGPDKDWANFRNALIVLAVMAVMSFLLCWAFKWDDSVYEDPEEAAAAAAVGASMVGMETPAKSNSVSEEEHPITGDAALASPCKGTYVAMKDIADPAMAQGALGTCFGVKPSDGTITSPLSGTVNSVAPTKHAITIYGDNGEQVMVHIGLDSIKLNGAGLQTFVKAGQRVRKGDRIASIQKAMFASENVDDTVVTILLNSKDYADIQVDGSATDVITAKAR
jgi:PTS system beta-glucosides-specific IIC component